mgnify:CR=1 FL=1
MTKRRKGKKKFMYVIYQDKLIEINRIGTTIQFLGDKIIVK